MVSNKRTAATDALATLGTILDETAGRDAVHVAVEPVVAEHDLMPGAHVGPLPNGRWAVVERKCCLGIVDPFLPGIVRTGQRFYLFLYPRTITGLRHVWTHPAFADEEASR